MHLELNSRQARRQQIQTTTSRETDLRLPVYMIGPRSLHKLFSQLSTHTHVNARLHTEKHIMITVQLQYNATEIAYGTL